MSLELDLRAWIEKSTGTVEQVVRASAIEIFASIVERSPVGDPTIWKVNKTARDYNMEVARFNSDLRSNPANLTKAGRLKRGLKVNDSMDIAAPAGYVGGRFRGNWQVTFGTPSDAVLDTIDKTGKKTIRAATNVLSSYDSSIPRIWFSNNLPYAYRLEYEGWSSQAPAGMVRVTIAEFQSIVDKKVRELT